MIHSEISSINVDNSMLLHISIVYNKTQMQAMLPKKSPYPHSSMEICKTQHHIAEPYINPHLVSMFYHFQQKRLSTFVIYNFKMTHTQQNKLGIRKAPYQNYSRWTMLCYRLAVKAPIPKQIPHCQHTL